MNNKQLLNITQWNDQEVRIEIFGNGHYILKENIQDWIKKNALNIACEVARNIK